MVYSGALPPPLLLGAEAATPEGPHSSARCHTHIKVYIKAVMAVSQLPLLVNALPAAPLMPQVCPACHACHDMPLCWPPKHTGHPRLPQRTVHVGLQRMHKGASQNCRALRGKKWGASLSMDGGMRWACATSAGDAPQGWGLRHHARRMAGQKVRQTIESMYEDHPHHGQE